MAKIVIIDGLARSGTTLLTAMLNSQKDIAAFRGIFHEPLASLKCNWPHDYARHPLINLSKDHYIKIDYNKLKKDTIESIYRINQTELLSLNEWSKIPIEKFQTINELDLFYQSLADRLSVNVLCFRWNQGLSHIFQWLRNPQHYWVCMIRNPMDRALSSFKTHQWSLDDSLINSIHYYTLMSQINLIKSNNIHFIYYEELVKYPVKEFEKLLTILGISLTDIQLESLKSQDGGVYRPEKSDNIDKFGDHRKGKVFNGFYLDSINRYQLEMNQDFINKYNQHLSNIPVLKAYFGNKHNSIKNSTFGVNTNSLCKKKIIFHVGYHKTGTTFLQSIIFPHLQNIHYLGKFYGNKTNIIDTEFINYIQFSDHFDPIIPQKKIIDNLRESSILISWERLLRPYRFERNLERLSKILSIFDEVKIIITIRRQDNLIWSRFQHDATLFKYKHPDDLKKALVEYVDQCAYPVCMTQINSCSCLKKGVKTISLPFYNFFYTSSLYSSYFDLTSLKFLPLELLENSPAKYLSSLYNFLEVDNFEIPYDKIHNKINACNDSQLIPRQPFNKILSGILNYYRYSNKMFSEKFNLSLDSYGYY